MDWRYSAIGIAMIAIGVSITLIFGNLVATGPLESFNQSRGMVQIGGIIAGIGVLVILASFGLERRRFTRNK